MVKLVEKIAVQIFGLWLFLRILTSLVVAGFSPLYPFTSIEQNIALWPPSGDLATWLIRVFLAPWERWDVFWFREILTTGYAAWNGTMSFHPLYPWLSAPLYWLGVNPTLSLLITSSLAALGLFWSFYRLAALDLEPTKARTALLLMITFPVAFILFAPYTESLFLLLTVLALYMMRNRRWGLAAITSFLATLTRQQGIFLALPLAWWAWVDSDKSLCGIKKAWPAWLSTLTPPAGLVAWGIYRIGVLHEGRLDFSNIQGLIYSALLSPSANKVVAGQAFRWPWDALAIAISKSFYKPEINIFVNLVLGLGFVVAFIVAWKYLNIADRVYSLAIIIVSFSVTTGEFAYISLPRHLFLALPVFVGFAAALRKSWQAKLLITLQFPLMLFLLVLYGFNQWIP